MEDDEVQHKGVMARITGVFSKAHPIHIILKHDYAPIITDVFARRKKVNGINILSWGKNKIVEPKADIRYSNKETETILLETDGKGNYRAAEWANSKITPVMTDDETQHWINYLHTLDTEYADTESWLDKNRTLVGGGVIVMGLIICIKLLLDGQKELCSTGAQASMDIARSCIEFFNISRVVR